MENCNCPDCAELSLNGLILQSTINSYHPTMYQRHNGTAHNGTALDVYDHRSGANRYPVTSYLSAPLSGLGGFTLSIDYTGAVVGTVIGLALNSILGWNSWQLSAIGGAVTGGLILPSISSI